MVGTDIGMISELELGTFERWHALSSIKIPFSSSL